MNMVATGAIAGAALSPTVALASNGPDPIFAAIERHRQLWAAHVAACNTAANEISREAVFAAEDRAGEICDQMGSALAELVAVTPTTVAGCAAMLRHIELYEIDYSTTALFSNRCDEVRIPAQDLLSRIAGVLAVQS